MGLIFTKDEVATALANYAEVTNRRVPPFVTDVILFFRPDYSIRMTWEEEEE